MSNADAKRERLAAAHAGQMPWYRWGSYLAERQWGTVREDYSPDGDTGRGVGASHQTGWTALVAKLLEQTDPTI